MRFKLADENPLGETIAAWAMLEAMTDEAEAGVRHRIIDDLLNDVRKVAARQCGWLNGRQMRTAVAFLLAAADYPPDAIDGELAPYWLTLEDAANAPDPQQYENAT